MTPIALRDIVPNPIDEDGVEISPPSIENTIKRLKNSKSEGRDILPAFFYDRM